MIVISLSSLQGQGFLSSPTGLEGFGFIRSGLDKEEWPDLEIFFLSAHASIDGGLTLKSKMIF